MKRPIPLSTPLSLASRLLVAELHVQVPRISVDSRLGARALLVYHETPSALHITATAIACFTWESPRIR